MCTGKLSGGPRYHGCLGIWLAHGFVSYHTPRAMTYLRGYADDMPLMKWLTEKIWPLEEKLQREDFTEAF